MVIDALVYDLYSEEMRPRRLAQLQLQRHGLPTPPAPMTPAGFDCSQFQQRSEAIDVKATTEFQYDRTFTENDTGCFDANMSYVADCFRQRPLRDGD